MDLKFEHGLEVYCALFIRRQRIHQGMIVISGIQITQTKTVKQLGVILNTKFNWWAWQKRSKFFAKR